MVARDNSFGEQFERVSRDEYDGLYDQRVTNEQLVEEPHKLYTFMVSSISLVALRATVGLSDLERIHPHLGDTHLTGNLHIKNRDFRTSASLASHIRLGEWQPARRYEQIRAYVGSARLLLDHGYFLEYTGGTFLDYLEHVSESTTLQPGELDHLRSAVNEIFEPAPEN